MRSLPWKPALRRQVILTLGYVALLTAIACGLAIWARRIDLASAKTRQSWPRSDDAQLRRGLALLLFGLASVLLSAQMVRYGSATEAASLGSALLIEGVCGWRVVKSFRAHGQGQS
jgi:hypothetical protein